MAASSRERSVTWAPGRACRTTPVSAAVSSRGPTIAITFGWGARFPRAQRGTTANWLSAGTPARLARPPAMCSRSRRPATDSALPWLTTALPVGDMSTGTAPAGAVPPPGRASAAAGNRAAGVPAVSAAYCCGSTIATGSETPWSDVPVVTEILATRWTPGTPVIRCCAAVVRPGPVGGAATTASAPAACHDAEMSARATPARAMAANATTANARMSAKAVSVSACAAELPRARPTTITTPRRRPTILVSWRRTSRYVRTTSNATGIAASTGAKLVNRSTLPGGGRPWSRRMIRPATAAQTSAPSATHRRAALILRRAGQRGPDDTGRQPDRQPRGGSGGEQDRRTGRQQGGGHDRGRAPPPGHGGDLTQRGPPRAHQRELSPAVLGDEPGAEQHHHGPDDGQADEHQRERTLHRGVGRDEGREHADEAGAQADRQQRLGARRGAEAGADGADGGQVGHPPGGLQQAGGLIGADVTQVEREAPHRLQLLPAQAAFQLRKLGGAGKHGAAQVGRAIGAQAGQPRHRRDGVDGPEGGGGAERPDDPADHEHLARRGEPGPDVQAKAGRGRRGDRDLERRGRPVPPRAGGQGASDQRGVAAQAAAVQDFQLGRPQLPGRWPGGAGDHARVDGQARPLRRRRGQRQAVTLQAAGELAAGEGQFPCAQIALIRAGEVGIAQ